MLFRNFLIFQFDVYFKFSRIEPTPFHFQGHGFPASPLHTAYCDASFVSMLMPNKIVLRAKLFSFTNLRLWWPTDQRAHLILQKFEFKFR